MKQRVLTFSRRFTGIDSYGFNLDSITTQLNEQGWTIKQIVNTTFQHHLMGGGQSFPVLVITLLVEKD